MRLFKNLGWLFVLFFQGITYLSYGQTDSLAQYRLLSNKAKDYYADNSYNLAVEYFEMALNSLLAKDSMSEYLDVAAYNLAYTQMLNEDYVEAEKHFVLSYKWYEQFRGADSTDYLIWLDKLPSMYKKNKEYDKAIPYYIKLFNLTPSAAVAKADRANQVGLCFANLSNYKDALVYFKKAIDVSENKDSAELGVYFRNAAYCAKKQGDVAESVGFYKRDLELLNAESETRNYIDKEIELIDLIAADRDLFKYAPKHFNHVLSFLQAENLEDTKEFIRLEYQYAGLYTNQNQLDSTLKYYASAAAKLNEHFKSDTADRIVVNNALAGAYFNKMQYDSASKYYKKAIDLQYLRGDVESIAYAAMLKSWSSCLAYLNDFASAEINCEKAIQIFEMHETRYPEVAFKAYENQRIFYHEQKKYEKELELTKKHFEKWVKINPDKDLAYVDWLEELGDLYKTNNDCESASQYYGEVYVLAEKLLVDEQYELFKQLNYLAKSIRKCDSLERAIAYFKEAKAALQQTDKNQTLTMSVLDVNIANVYFAKEEFDSSYTYYKYGEKLASEIKDDENLAYVTANLALCYWEMDSMVQCKNYIAKAEQLYKKIDYEESSMFQAVLDLKQKMEGDRQAEEALLEAHKKQQETFTLAGPLSQAYFSSFLPIIKAHVELELYDSAHYYVEQAYKLKYTDADTGIQKIINEKTYQIGMLELALLKLEIDKHVKDTISLTEKLIAEGFAVRALPLLFQERGSKHLDKLDYSEVSILLDSNSNKVSEELDSFDRHHSVLLDLRSFSDLAFKKYMDDNLFEAAESYETLLLRSVTLFESETLETYLIHKILANIYQMLRVYDKASDHLEQALSGMKKIYGNEHINYLQVQFDKCDLYIGMGRYDEAMKLVGLLTESTDRLFGPNEEISLKAWYYFGKLSSEYGNHKNAKYAFTYVKEYTGDSVKTSVLYAETLFEMARLYERSHLENLSFNELRAMAPMNISFYKTMNGRHIRNLREATGIYQLNYGEHHPKLAIMHCTEAYLIGLNGYADSANELYDKYLPILEKQYGTMHPEYARIKMKIADLNYIYGDTNSAAVGYMEANEISIAETKKVFSISSDKYRKSYLEKIMLEFDKLQLFNYETDNPFTDFSEVCLNNHLMIKGLLLHNQKNMLSNLTSLNNVEIDEMLVDFQKSRKIKAKELSLPAEERTIDIEQLFLKTDSIERVLVQQHHKTFPNALVTVPNWQTIEQALGEDEIALEFIRFNFLNAREFPDSAMYGVFIIKKGMEYPSMEYLFTEEQVKNTLRSGNQNILYAARGVEVQDENDVLNEDLYEMIFGELEPWLEGVAEIHYSPTGVLHQIPFAALVDGDGTAMCQRFDMRQYNNVLDIKQPQTLAVKDVLLVGGVAYDYTSEVEIIKPSKKKTNFAWAYLPGTLTETSTLSTILQSNNVKTAWWKGADATENRFYSIDKSSPQILHVSTHGFYRKEEQIDSSKLLKRIVFYEEDPLSRSGILLSGANFAWQYGYNPNEEEDGILTAAEIANLDLSNTQLAVLSACETGLGDIEGNEGVYGLQRAFKMAGVDKLIMSLWQVPDAETSEFMILFYAKLVEFNDVRKAFNITQKSMQAKYKDEPYKWAAFILVE